jgi:tyrosine-protein kinase Etk/Wzc
MNMELYELEENGAADAQKLDLSRYIAALRRRWWLAAAIALTITIPWVLYVKKELPVYEATASIRFRDFAGNSENLMEDIYEQITSRSFIEQVVSDLGLVVSLEQNEDREQYFTRRQIFSKFTSTHFPEAGNYILRFAGDGSFSIFVLNEDGDEIKLRTVAVARATADTIAVKGFSFQLADQKNLPPEVAFEITPFRGAVKSLQDRIGVDLNRAWTLMFVTLRDNDPYLVTQTVNSLANIFINKSKAVGKESHGNQLETYQAQAERAKRDYDEIDGRYTEALRRVGLGGQSGFQMTFEQRRVAAAELQTLTEQQEHLETLLTRISSSGTKTHDENRLIYAAIASSKVFDNNPTMAITRQRLDALEADYGKQIELKNETHSDVVELQGQIDQLCAQVAEIARAKLTTLRREVGRKQTEVNQLVAKISELPTQSSTLEELGKERDRKFQLYMQLQAETQKLEISSAAEEIGSIEVLDPAIEPQFPINRNKAAKAAGGAAIGFLLGIGVVLAMEALDRTIKTVDDAKNNMKLNVLGAIPQINFGDYFDFQDNEKAKMVDQQLVTHDFAPTPVGEAYRSLRTNILFSKSAGRIQTFVITSTAPADGKSFTAANLSICMAQQKSNTLLVDTDMRRGVLHNTFGVPKEPGFSNYLMGSMLAAEIIHETHIPNLSVISCGSLIPNPSELLGSVQLRRFLDEMRRRFDLIIFDTPPLNAATDAVVLGTQVDGVVIVVRSGKTRKEVARQKLELFKNVHAKIIGVILNGTAVDLAHEGYSYYHY